MSYSEENLKYQPFDHAAVIELAEHASRLGVQFKIEGIPFGAPFNRDLWEKFYGQSSETSVLRAGTGLEVYTGHVGAGEAVKGGEKSDHL